MSMKPAKNLAELLGAMDPLRPMDVVSLPEVNEKTLSARDFCLAIVNSQQYRDSLVRRIVLDDLPPQVETWVLSTAYGKPVDRVEVKDTTVSLENAPLDALEQRISFLMDVARRLRKDEVMDAEPVKGGTIQ